MSTMPRAVTFFDGQNLYRSVKEAFLISNMGKVTGLNPVADCFMNYKKGDDS